MSEDTATTPEMIQEIRRNVGSAEQAVAAARSVRDLRAAQTEVLGRSAPLTLMKKRLGGLAAADRRDVGRALNEARERLESIVAERAALLEAEERSERLDDERLDLTETPARARRGHLHLVTQTRDRLEDVFVGMGFTVAEGPEVETDWNNFEALNLPAEHPARGMWDTLYVDLGEPGTVLLRTHTSPVQIRVMTAQPPPVYAVMPGRVFRRDTADASHMPVFHQIEGLVVDRGVGFADMSGTLEAFTTGYFGGAIHSRLRPSYFPFTEPSAEFDINCVICEGAGCRTCGNTGWVELGGCGMVHPAVLANCGIDPEEWSGFAFGFGIDRLALMKHGIDDLRELFTNDVRFLRQF